jgi:ribonuclease/clavin/mitogillin
VGRVTLTVLHAPGHTRGQINVWFEQEKILFAGDNVVGEGTTWIGPPDGNLSAYLDTLRRLQTFGAKRIAPGHGGMVENPAEKIAFLIERRLLRERQILTLLREKNRTSEELTQIIYKDQIPPFLFSIAERTVIGHLDKLAGEGKVTRYSQGNKYIYALSDANG